MLENYFLFYAVKMHGIFITGTGTGVGKTEVTAGMVRYLRGQGVDAVPMKPVQTGAHRAGQVLRAPDLEYVLEAAGLSPAPESLRLMAPYVYEPACSPHLAALLADYPLDLDIIRECVETLLARHEFLVLEGAGGILVPLSEQVTLRDLMVAIGFPVLLVAQAGLGTLNHTLLSLESLRAKGLEVLAVVLNELDPDGDAYIREDNLRYLREHAGVPVWGVLPHQSGLSAEQFQATLAEGLRGLMDTIAQTRRNP